MKKPTILFIVTFLLFNLFIITPEPITITYPASAIRYGMDTNISKADASFISEKGWSFSTSMSCSGDVNGDGYDDILLATPYYDLFNGSVYIFFGNASGWSLDISLSDADASFVGEKNQYYAGTCVAIAGDVNDDGYDDILISEKNKVCLIFGKSSEWIMYSHLSNVDASFLGEYAKDRAGQKVAGAGDVNGDGYDDILIAADWNDEGGNAAGQVYLILGKSTGWSINTSLSQADASFIGENPINYAGGSITGAGDVNGDGYDDILIGAHANDEGGDSAGQAYLIFGKASGWTRDIRLYNANASFIGENAGDIAGGSVAGVGDVNSDGFDDILIGAGGNDEGGENAGQVYLIFGKKTGWTMDTNLSKVDASFLGENMDDWISVATCGAGDVNGDGYEDILIGVERNKEGGDYAGQAYLILGKSSGWSNNTNLSHASASFIGENEYVHTGVSVAGGGDVNGDGNHDILIGARKKVYLIFPELNSGPKVIYSVKAYSDMSYTNKINLAEVGDTVFVELTGLDGNATNIDKAVVNVNVTSGSLDQIRLYLVETGLNTGKYHGSFKISNRTSSGQRLVNATIGDNIKITSINDPTKNTTILVSTPVQLRPLYDKTSAVEDELYYMNYYSIGYNTVYSWIFDTDASFLSWDDSNYNLSGTPGNGDVGISWVRLNISDAKGHYDEHNFTITVRNTVPSILTENVPEAFEDELYFVDYNSDDEGMGGAYWQLETDASWLTLDSASGVLSGTPENDNVGPYLVEVTILDGHGFKNWTEFILTVIDTNDAPIIITEDITNTIEDDYYSVDYDVNDIDGDVIFVWYLETNASSWLTINEYTGVLSGTPENSDVGLYYVNVTVKDSRSGTASHNFTLEVMNVNDPPDWSDVPDDVDIAEGELFVFDVNATDADKNDDIVYEITTAPHANITIDPSTGIIQWTATIEGLKAPGYRLSITVKATDGKYPIWTTFHISVLENPRPTAFLLTPFDGNIISYQSILLEWKGYDEFSEPLTYDVYLHQKESFISFFREDARILECTNATEFIPDGLEIGAIYYWTVIPHDGLSYGTCMDGIFSFIVNSPPTISGIAPQKATVGKAFSLELDCRDINPGDSKNFIFSLDFAPEGMNIDSSTGVITWTPDNSQVGTFTVKVMLTDRKDYTNETFEIEVIKSARELDFFSATNLFPVAIVIVIILIIFLFIGTIVFIKLRRRKKRIIPEVEYIPPFSAGLTARPRTISPPTVIIDQVSSLGQQSQMPITPATAQEQTPSIPTPTAVRPLLPPASGQTPTLAPTLAPTPVPIAEFECKKQELLR